MSERKTVIYLAGPMSGLPDFNRQAFNEAARVLRGEGRIVNNPAEIDGGSTDKLWEFYMSRAICWLVCSDEVWVLDGWHKSRGACIEVRLALILNKKVREYGNRMELNWHLLDFTLANAAEFIAGNVYPELALPPKPEETICQEADRLTAGDRQSSYGHPFHNFSRTAKIWEGIFGIPVTPEQVALAMVGVKIARECHQPKRDNLVDGAAYFKCLDMVRQYRAEHAE